jgi:arylsulfatase A-like enzyme
VTPHLDKLAEEGVRLTDFYVSHPSCTPSRAGLLTGRYPQRYGTTGALVIKHHAAFSKDGKWSGGIPTSEILLPKLLKEKGYATGCFGKWHLGFTPKQQPNNRGFDEYLVCAAGHTDFFTGLFFGVPDIYKNGELVDFSGYTTDVFADAAIDFIREKKDKPFFVYLPFNAVHYSCPTNHPDGETKHGENYKNIVQAPEEVLQEFCEFPRQRQHYLAALKCMDQAVGRLDEALDEMGLKENTLVIFFSDNGGDMDYGADNGALRGEKGQIWDGGIRVPALV